MERDKITGDYIPNEADQQVLGLEFGMVISDEDAFDVMVRCARRIEEANEELFNSKLEDSFGEAAFDHRKKLIFKIDTLQGIVDCIGANISDDAAAQARAEKIIGPAPIV